jgi:hypothetical protein
LFYVITYFQTLFAWLVQIPENERSLISISGVLTLQDLKRGDFARLEDFTSAEVNKRSLGIL